MFSAKKGCSRSFGLVLIGVGVAVPSRPLPYLRGLGKRRRSSFRDSIKERLDETEHLMVLPTN